MPEGQANGNWKGGVCEMRHVDQMLNFPEYLEKIKSKINTLTVKLDDDCWVWLGMVDKRDNRAYIKVGSRRWPVARILMLVKHGEVGLLVACHACDNPGCVNPNHLWLGTCRDNNNDAWAKGRVVPKRGEDSPLAKLTLSDVLAIREQFSNGAHATELAEQYSVCVTSVYNILSKRRWKHVK